MMTSDYQGICPTDGGVTDWKKENPASDLLLKQKNSE